MNSERILQITGEIDEAYITEALEQASGAEKTAQKKRGGKILKISLGLAAAAALALCLGVFVPGALEYRAAAAFFAENGLDPEGLTRAEIRAVYRDITARSFTDENTAAVLERSVPGFALQGPDLNPAALEEVWTSFNMRRTVPAKGVGFRFDYTERYADALGFEILDKSIVERCLDGETQWTAAFPYLYAEKARAMGADTAVWGFNETWNAGETRYAWLARVSETGEVLWQTPLGHGFSMESIVSVLETDGGDWAVVSRGELNWLCLSVFGPDGAQKRFYKLDIGQTGVSNAARLGDGYLVQVVSLKSREHARILWLDGDWNLLQDVSYEAETCDYYITDMAEFAGSVYLSAYAVPRQADPGGRDEIAGVLNAIYTRPDGWEIPTEELTALLQKNYTALLLICDPAGGDPQTFYSVNGALGDTLTVNGGTLEWEVHGIASAFFSPATSAFSIGGTCAVSRYAFSAEGELLRQTDTGETAPYYR